MRIFGYIILQSKIFLEGCTMLLQMQMLLRKTDSIQIISILFF